MTTMPMHYARRTVWSSISARRESVSDQQHKGMERAHPAPERFGLVRTAEPPAAKRVLAARFAERTRQSLKRSSTIRYEKGLAVKWAFFIERDERIDEPALPNPYGHNFCLSGNRGVHP